ncbi:hypothetical protein [Pedobacter sp. Hv1]|uniref:hypothetical protein n=1 Tax=Pedobacter sp. Hv1 TaxID=1740090 RepID=UPI0006D8A3BD|nr:hypothetical protein [Pedobacter sp. Hv1]KQB99602.1 hypothetical protein AQF98_18795 [Pedobacter sp. Hv1]
MKKIGIVFLLLLGAVNGFGQEIEKGKETSIILYCGARKVDPAKGPIYIVNNKYIMFPTGDFGSRLQVSDIERLTIPKKSDSLVQLYGEKSKNGVVKLDLYSNVSIYQIDELFDLFRIKDKYRSLPLYLNDELITDRANFFITATAIKKVKVVNKPTAEVADLKFIAIKTKP